MKIFYTNLKTVKQTGILFNYGVTSITICHAKRQSDVLGEWAVKYIFFMIYCVTRWFQRRPHFKGKNIINKYKKLLLGRYFTRRNLFKVDKFAKIQYTYIHKSSQTNWLIRVNYPILQKKNLLIKIKEKEKKVKTYVRQVYWFPFLNSSLKRSNTESKFLISSGTSFQILGSR